MKIKTVFLLIGQVLFLNIFLYAQTPFSVTATANPTVICEGAQTTLQAIPSGGTGTYTYVWESNPPGNPTNPLTTTVYTVTVDDGSETASASVTVIVNHVPGAAGSIIGPDSVCEGSLNNVYSIPLIPNATTYTWTVPIGTTFSSCGTNVLFLRVYNGAISGILKVFGINTCGVGSFSSIPLTVNPSPIANAGIDQIISQGATATLNGSATGASGSYRYGWSPTYLLQNANVQNPITVPLTSSTVFTLVVTDSSTGCQGTDYTHVYAGGTPLSCFATANPATICQGSCTTLQAIPSGGSVSYTYTWTSNPMGFASTLQSPVVCPTITTQYILVVFDGSQSVSASITVEVVQAPDTLGTITGLTDVCTGTNNVVYTVPTAPTITNYFWNLPAGASIISGQNTNSIVVNYGSNAVSGYITVTGSSACGCTIPDSLAVMLHSPPVADAGLNQNINCGGYPVNIGTTATAGMVYSWSPSYALSNPNIAQPIAAPYGNTIYILTVTDTSTGCYATDSVLITAIGAPVADAGVDQNINCGGPGVMIGTAPIIAIAYSWAPANGLSDDSIAQPVATPLTTTEYILTVVDMATGCFSTDDVIVALSAAPTANAGIDQTIYSGTTDTLNGSATGGSGNYSYSWSPANLLVNANVQNPITLALASTTVFTLVVTDSVTGCTESDSVQINIIITNIKEVSDFTFDLYPNPTSGSITIEMSNYISEKLTLKVFNIIGDEVFNMPLKNEKMQSFNLSSFANGLYFVKIFGNNFNKTGKFIIQKK